MMLVGRASSMLVVTSPCFCLASASLRARCFGGVRRLEGFERRRQFSISPALQSGSMMGRYESFLKSNYPRVYSVHRLIVGGGKTCVSDLKTYFRIKKDLRANNRSLSDLSVEELIIYIQTPNEILHILTLLTLLMIPIIGDALVVLVIFFPRLILTRHFWTTEQRRDFWSRKIASNVHDTYPSILNHLGDSLPKEPIDWKKASQIKIPSLRQLSIYHLIDLCRIHRTFIFGGVKSLEHRALVLRHLDIAMANSIKSSTSSNVVKELKVDDLYMHLYLRNIPFQNRSNNEMRNDLSEWISHAIALSKDESLYLHLPVLLPRIKSDSNSDE